MIAFSVNDVTGQKDDEVSKRTGKTNSQTLRTSCRKSWRNIWKTMDRDSQSDML